MAKIKKRMNSDGNFKTRRIVSVDTNHPRALHVALSKFYDKQFNDFDNANYYQWLNTIAKNDVIVKTADKNDIVLKQCNDLNIEVKHG